MLNYIDTIDFTSIRKLNLNDQKQSYETLNFTELNIFIGPNGSGKSTILDILHCFSNQEKITTLMRENNPSTAKSEIKITFNNNYLKIFLYPTTKTVVKGEEHSIEYYDSRFEFHNKNIKSHINIQLKKTNRKFNIQKLNKFFKNFNNLIKVNYLDINAINIPTKKFAETLNEISFFLNGIVNQKTKDEVEINNPEIVDLSPAFNEENKFIKEHYKNNNLLSLSLNDDLIAQNNIPIDMLPSGWISIVKILYFLKEAKNYSICLIEEPENHLHPKLQRILINKIKEYIEKKYLQIFITTHSPTLINITDNNNLKISLFEATTDSIIKLKNQNNLLNELGTKASDILQTNGIIWVEGPSDRIYIKYWLEMWCKLNNKVCPIENIHYSFSIYGGSIINHFSLKENDFKDLIDLLKLNRNAIIVIDNDNHFKKNEDGEYLLIDKKGENKKRIIEEMKSSNNKNLYIWLTEGYTIESYLNKNFIKLNFDLELNHRIKLKIGKNKVQIAKNYIEKGKFKNKYDLFKQIEKVYNTLLKWN